MPPNKLIILEYKMWRPLSTFKLFLTNHYLVVFLAKVKSGPKVVDTKNQYLVNADKSGHLMMIPTVHLVNLESVISFIIRIKMKRELKFHDCLIGPKSV